MTTVYLRDANTGELVEVVIGSTINVVSVEQTRPGDTTSYTAGDVVGTIQTVANFARVEGGSGYIVGARLSTDKKSITPRIRVHLFNASNPTLAAENVAYKELYADASKRLGYFDLLAMTTATDTTNSDMSRAIDMALRIPFKAADGIKSIYFILETLDAFAPAASQKFTLTLYGDVD